MWRIWWTILSKSTYLHGMFISFRRSGMLNFILYVQNWTKLKTSWRSLMMRTYATLLLFYLLWSILLKEYKKWKRCFKKKKMHLRFLLHSIQKSFTFKKVDVSRAGKLIENYQSWYSESQYNFANFVNYFNSLKY